MADRAAGIIKDLISLNQKSQGFGKWQIRKTQNQAS
jgi:hypothetical protein